MVNGFKKRIGCGIKRRDIKDIRKSDVTRRINVKKYEIPDILVYD